MRGVAAYDCEAVAVPGMLAPYAPKKAIIHAILPPGLLGVGAAAQLCHAHQLEDGNTIDANATY